MNLRLLYDLLPISVFFISYQYTKNIYTSTKLVVIIALIQLFNILIKKKNKLKLLNILNLSILIFFGIATLYTTNDNYIKLKPTILYIFLSFFILITYYCFKINIFKRMTSEKFSLNDDLANKINISWSIFFLILSAMNLFVGFSGYFNQSQWVYFKTIGTFLITFIFLIIQSFIILKYKI